MKIHASRSLKQEFFESIKAVPRGWWIVGGVLVFLASPELRALVLSIPLLILFLAGLFYLPATIGRFFGSLVGGSIKEIKLAMQLWKRVR